jgi:N-acetylglucosaminyl-diphospho-decaprenol L-rhamnosyltransferase
VSVPHPGAAAPPPPRTTVVVVTYRSREHLPACLEAVEAASGEAAIETVIVDNGSDDGTVAYLRRRQPQARVIENGSNRGFSAAVNQGVKATRGDCLLLLNPDVVLGAGSLGRLLRALDEDPRVGLAGPLLLYPDGRPQRSTWDAPSLRALAFEALLLYNLFPRSRLSPIRARVPDEAEDVSALSGACLLVRRSCFEELDGLDERFFLYFEDVDLGLRARGAGWRARLVPAARAVHQQGGSAFKDRRAFWRHYEESRRALLRKHMRGTQRLAAETLQLIGLAVRVVVYALAGFLGRSRLSAEARHLGAALWALVRRPSSPGADGKSP